MLYLYQFQEQSEMTALCHRHLHQHHQAFLQEPQQNRHRQTSWLTAAKVLLM